MRALLLSLLLCGPACADVVLVADAPDGSRVLITNEAGPCVGDARLAVYVAKDQSRVNGCWVARPPYLAIVFLDGDVAQVPIAALKKPTSL